MLSVQPKLSNNYSPAFGTQRRQQHKLTPEETEETGEDEDSLRKGSGSALLRPVSTMVRMTASSKRMAPARILCRFKKRILSRSFRFLSSFGTVSILCSA